MTDLACVSLLIVEEVIWSRQLKQSFVPSDQIFLDLSFELGNLLAHLHLVLLLSVGESVEVFLDHCLGQDSVCSREIIVG